MPSLRELLLSSLAPLVAAALTAWLVRSRGGWSAAVVGGLAVGWIGLTAHQVGLAAALGRLVRPQQATDWLPAIAAAAAVAGTFAASGGRTALVGWLALSALAPAALWRLLAGGKYLPTAAVRATGFAKEAWSLGTASLTLGGVAAVTLAATALWRRRPASENDDAVGAAFSRGALVACAVGVVAATTGLTGSMALALLGGAVASAVGGAALGVRFRPGVEGPEAAAGPILFPLAAMLTLAVAYSQTTLWQAAPLAAAAVLAASPAPASLASSARIRATVVALLAAPVLIVAIVAFVKAIQPQTAPW